MNGPSESVDSSLDLRMMRYALRLARRGAGHVSPNPMVGAVVVKNGDVVAAGYHRRHGGPHAEIEALSKTGFSAVGCTLYVSLEPCCHHGLTPPCTNAVISSGVSRVVIGTVDPNPLVAGKGIEALRNAGIDVTVGVADEECRELNRAFFKWISTGRPWVTLKMASTLDGRTADRGGSSKWITGTPARRDVHAMRAVSDCVMVGSGTALADDPLLLPTMVDSRRVPARAVVSPDADLPVDSKLVTSVDRGRVLVVTSVDAPVDRVDRLRKASVDIVSVETTSGGLNLANMLDELGARRITSLLVEGGATLAASLLSEGLVDRMVLYVAPMLMADPEAPGVCGDIGIRNLSDSLRFNPVSSKMVGGDLRIVLQPVR